MSQGEAAALVGLSRSAFGNIETGRYRAGAGTQRRLLEVLEGCVADPRDDLDGEPGCQTISTKFGAC
jgi:DNA-binding XRE family transcriptional regulator